MAGFETLIDFADARITARRAGRDDTLLSDHIAAEKAGQLGPGDPRNRGIVMAGVKFDNSAHQIAIAVIELASRIRERLGTDPSLVPASVREVMRHHPRTISTSREAMQENRLAGVEISGGTPILANIGATHWDARDCTPPDGSISTAPKSRASFLAAAFFPASVAMA